MTKAPSSAAIALVPLMPMYDLLKRDNTSSLTASIIGLGTAGRSRPMLSLIMSAIS